jgi:hypothetical protein
MAISSILWAQPGIDLKGLRQGETGFNEYHCQMYRHTTGHSYSSGPSITNSDLTSLNNNGHVSDTLGML